MAVIKSKFKCVQVTSSLDKQGSSIKSAILQPYSVNDSDDKALWAGDRISGQLHVDFVKDVFVVGTSYSVVLTSL